MSSLHPTLEATEKPPPLSHTPAAFATVVSTHSFPLPHPPSTSHPWSLCRFLCCLHLSLLLIVLAIAIPLDLSSRLSSTLNTSLTVLSSPTSPSFPSFTSNALNPYTLTVHLYNLTSSPSSLLYPSPSSPPPSFAEVGPFTFTNLRSKLDLSFSPDAQQLSYRDVSAFTFDPSRSCPSCSPTTPITSLNMVALALYHSAATDRSNVIPLVGLIEYHDAVSSDAELFLTTRPAFELLFGYAANLSSDADSAIVRFPGFFPNQTAADASNLSAILTGVDMPDKARQLLAYHGQSVQYTCTGAEAFCARNTTVWKTVAASTVEGSDGGVFPAPVTSESQPLLFYSPVARAVELQWLASGEWLGVDTQDFAFPSSMWAGGKGEDGVNGEYWQGVVDGALNVSSLSSFVPTFLSTPRFGSIPRTSPFYPNLTLISASLPPSPTSSLFSIHPPSGLTLHFSTSTLVSVYLTPFNLSWLDSDPPTVWGAELRQGLIPLFSAQLEGGVNEQQATELGQVDLVERGVWWSGWVMGGLGGVGLLLAAWLGVRWRRAVKGAEKGVEGREEPVGERARLKVGGSGGRVWYGQAPQDPTEVEEDDSRLDEAEEEEEPEERLRLGYRY